MAVTISVVLHGNIVICLSVRLCDHFHYGVDTTQLSVLTHRVETTHLNDTKTPRADPKLFLMVNHVIQQQQSSHLKHYASKQHRNVSKGSTHKRDNLSMSHLSIWLEGGYHS